MKLSGVANSFNNLLCRDAYTAVEAFKAQLDLYDDNKRDSETAGRRVISTSASSQVPPRRVIDAGGTKYILGHGNPDSFRGKVVRVGYVAQESPFLCRVRTLSQVCLSQEGTYAYSGRAWVKNAAYTEQSSHLAPVLHLHFASTETVDENSVVECGGKLYVVREASPGPGGTLVTLCEEMASPSVEAGMLLNAVRDPVTEIVAGTPLPAIVVRVRWQALFKYGSQMAPKFGAGDCQLAIAKAVAGVVPGAEVTLSDGVWRIASAMSVGDVWLCRATHVQ